MFALALEAAAVEAVDRNHDALVGVADERAVRHPLEVVWDVFERDEKPGEKEERNATDWSNKYCHLVGKIEASLLIQSVKIQWVISSSELELVLVLKTLFNIVDARFKKLQCLCCVIIFRWTNKQPGVRKFWNLSCHYQNIYDWIFTAEAYHWGLITTQGCISVIYKNSYPPSKSGRFSVNLYPIVRHIFHRICINLLELNTKVFIFFSCTRVL